MSPRTIAGTRGESRCAWLSKTETAALNGGMRECWAVVSIRCGDVVQRVVSDIVQQGQPGSGANSWEMEFVDMPCLKSIDEKPHGLPVLADLAAQDAGTGVVDFWAAVGTLIDVGIGGQLEALGLHCRWRVNWLCERQFESIMTGAHFVNFEGYFARPVQTF